IADKASAAASMVRPPSQELALLESRQRVTENMEWVEAQLSSLRHEKAARHTGGIKPAGTAGGVATKEAKERSSAVAGDMATALREKEIQLRRAKEALVAMERQQQVLQEKNMEQVEKARQEKNMEQAEKARQDKNMEQAELARKRYQMDRVQAQLERVQADGDRMQAEQARMQAERELREIGYDKLKADRLRQEAESDRLQADRTRLLAEQARQQAARDRQFQ